MTRRPFPTLEAAVAYAVGAQTGTTSLDTIEEAIAPTAGAQVFDTNDDARLALESGQAEWLGDDDAATVLE
ncbi:hypothetical protein [Agromyces bauzanensis]|uniref:Uncharacterized protein n=1 Tax=Agromyces bauzanensis TaxID=1308924 RepID=A0A917PCE8_9MICO|nr:hypothetical protein [Agromyces bauzanensis]GGJ70727.1 hypothetical protein GCM10011372_05780 [Agromyces bauzanensis]